MHGISVARKRADGQAGVLNLAAKILGLVRACEQRVHVHVVFTRPATCSDFNRGDTGKRSRLRHYLVESEFHKNGREHAKLH